VEVMEDLLEGSVDLQGEDHSMEIQVPRLVVVQSILLEFMEQKKTK